LHVLAAEPHHDRAEDGDREVSRNIVAVRLAMTAIALGYDAHMLCAYGPRISDPQDTD
jgi:hypothetical protein